jgi:hypothetical protein
MAAPQNANGQTAETEQSFVALWQEAEAKAAAAEAAGEIPPSSDDEPAKDEAKPEPEKKPAKAKAKAEPEENADGERVIPSERENFRAWKRTERNKLKAERESFEKAKGDWLEQTGREVGPIFAAAKALKSEDWDGFAKAVAAAAGVDAGDWSALNKHVATVFHSPEHKRIVAIERERAQEREERERERAEAARTAETSRKQKARDDYRGYVVESLRGREDDPGLAELAKSGSFVSLLFSLHEQAFSEHGEVDEEDALDRALEIARTEYETLGKFFSEQAASQPETPPARPGSNAASPARPGPNAAKRGVRRPKSVSQARAVEASPQGEMTEEQWKRWASEQLRNSD